MFKGTKKESQAPSSFDVILGKTAEFTGSIRSEGSIRMDGKGTGDMHSKGDVIIGVDSALEGNIEADNVEISGEVHGNIKASGAFRIFETGILFGDISVSSFVIDEGGVFEGMCHINTRGVKQVLPSKQNNKSSDDKLDIHKNSNNKDSKNDDRNKQDSQTEQKDKKTPA